MQTRQIITLLKQTTKLFRSIRVSFLQVLLISSVFAFSTFAFASSANAGASCGWCGTSKDCPGGFAGSGAGYCSSGTSCCAGWNPGTSGGGSTGGGSTSNTCQTGNTYCKGKTFGSKLSISSAPGYCYCNSVSGSDCACQTGINGGGATSNPSPAPTAQPGTGGPGGTGQFTCPANQVCNGVQKCPSGSYDLTTCPGATLVTTSFIVACDCNGDGKTDTQRTTYDIKGSQASSYCSSVMCASSGSTVTWDGKTYQKICEPGVTISCSSMGSATSPGTGVVCNSDGQTTSTVRSDACIASTITNYTTNPAGCTKNYVGCSGNMNCYSCGAGKAPYCVSEPGLSCGAKATPVPTTTTTTTTTTNNPTPTPPETPPFVCLRVTKDIDSPTFGQSVRFTCGTVSTATRYEFQYRVGSIVGPVPLLNATSNITEPFAITQAGSYKVQCRPCKDTQCTAWTEDWSNVTPAPSASPSLSPSPTASSSASPSVSPSPTPTATPTATPTPTPSPTPNLQTDNNNCGTIGTVCQTGMTCTAGVCM